MKWLFDLIDWFVGKLFGQPPGPSAEAKASADAATAEVKAADAVQVAKVETAVAQAEVDAPRTQPQVVKSLDDGTF